MAIMRTTKARKDGKILWKVSMSAGTERGIVVCLELIRTALLSMPPARDFPLYSSLLFSCRLGNNAGLACARPGWSARSGARRGTSGFVCLLNSSAVMNEL